LGRRTAGKEQTRRSNDQTHRKAHAEEQPETGDRSEQGAAAMAGRADRDYPGVNHQERRHNEYELDVELQDAGDEQQLENGDNDHGSDRRSRCQLHRSRRG
jgi:hypothetical protein